MILPKEGATPFLTLINVTLSTIQKLCNSVCF